MLETSSPLAHSLISLTGFGLFGLLMLTFLRPAVRGAGPPIVQALMGSLLAVTVVLAVVAVFDDSADDAPIVASDWLVFFAVLVPLLAASAWLAWRLPMRLASRYAAKGFSDLQLAHDAYWSLITAVVATAVLMLSFEENTQRSHAPGVARAATRARPARPPAPATPCACSSPAHAARASPTG
jgi:signal transduction histidine kinase